MEVITIIVLIISVFEIGILIKIMTKINKMINDQNKKDDRWYILCFGIHRYVRKIKRYTIKKRKDNKILFITIHTAIRQLNSEWIDFLINIGSIKPQIRQVHSEKNQSIFANYVTIAFAQFNYFLIMYYLTLLSKPRGAVWQLSSEVSLCEHQCGSSSICRARSFQGRGCRFKSCLPLF